MNNTSYALPAPRCPVTPAPSEGVAKTQHIHTAKQVKARDTVVRRISALGNTLQGATGMNDVQVDGVGNFHGVGDDVARCLLISHALDPRDAVLTAGAGLKAVRKPNGEWQALSPLMRKSSGVAGKIESLFMKVSGVKPYVTQVQTPGRKRLEGEALAASKRANNASLEAGRQRLIREGGVQIIFPQGNVKGPGPIDIAGVGAVKAYSQHDGKPLVFIPVGITYEPIVPKSGVRRNSKAFYNFGKPVVVTQPIDNDASLARALELELAKVHTFTASGIAGAHVFKQRENGKQPSLLENEFKAIVTREVDELVKHSDVNVDVRLRDEATRERYLHDSYKTLVAKGFVDAKTGAVQNVGPAADFDQAPKLRPDAKTEGVVLRDPLRFNGNRVRQVLRASPTLQYAFDAVSQNVSDSISLPTTQRAKPDALRAACAMM